MIIESDHIEQWRITITRQGDDDWPVTPVHWSRTGQRYQPEVINVSLMRGTRHPTVHMSGRRLKKDGTPGEAKVADRYMSRDQVPDWAQELIRQARTDLGLGPYQTEVGE